MNDLSLKSPTELFYLAIKALNIKNYALLRDLLSIDQTPISLDEYSLIQEAAKKQDVIALSIILSSPKGAEYSTVYESLIATYKYKLKQMYKTILDSISLYDISTDLFSLMLLGKDPSYKKLYLQKLIHDLNTKEEKKMKDLCVSLLNVCCQQNNLLAAKEILFLLKKVKGKDWVDAVACDAFIGSVLSENLNFTKFFVEKYKAHLLDKEQHSVRIAANKKNIKMLHYLLKECDLSLGIAVVYSDFSQICDLVAAHEFKSEDDVHLFISKISTFSVPEREDIYNRIIDLQTFSKKYENILPPEDKKIVQIILTERDPNFFVNSVKKIEL